MKLRFFTEDAPTKALINDFISEWNSDVPYFESKTSGSTGQPKTIRIEKKHAHSSASATASFFQFSADTKAFLCLNPATIGGKMMLVRSLLFDMTLYVVQPSSNPLKNFDEQLDFLSIAPIQLHTILNENPEKLKSISNIIVGGGIISTETITLLKKHQITVFQTFGMTETISHVALRKVGFEEESHYTTLNGVTVSEENGQLCMHAENLGLTNLRTNDSVEILNEKQFKWKGRIDFVINSGGVKLQMEEIEDELSQMISVPFFIYKMPDAKLGEQVILVVEGSVQKELQQKMSYSKLSNPYFIPKKIAFTPHFIRTASDKINRIATFNSINESSFIQIL